MFADFFRWVSAYQSAFYQQLTQSIKDMKSDGTAFWTLIVLSFLYGIFHAAGPGHGKIIMSSYVLANRETARRGAVLCFLSSMLQAAIAVAMITILAVVLNATSFVISDTTQFLETASYALIVILGFVLLWRALRNLWPAKKPHHHHHADHVHDEHCGCGHAHAPTAELAEQTSTGNLKTAAAAVISVGLRPCTGALIVLVFSLAHGLFWAGILSAFAMGIGTAITVTTLMFIAVSTRHVAYAMTGGSGRFYRLASTSLPLLGAIAVLTLGLILLIAKLQ
ncbi:MAG: nickel transporter [Hyphomicrobiales bacterium]|nr:MAG: nickel transporter [Hyphomicrobiales bacterium]